MKYKSHFFKLFIVTGVLTLFSSYHYKMENGLDSSITEKIIENTDQDVRLKTTETKELSKPDNEHKKTTELNLLPSDKSNEMIDKVIFIEEKKEKINTQLQEAGVDTSILEKFEQDLSAYGNQLGAYNGFKIEKKLDEIYHEMANSSQKMEFTIIDPYGNKVLFYDCHSKGYSLSRAVIDNEYKTIKGQMRYCTDNNTNEHLRVRVEKIYKEAAGEKLDQKYLLSYKVENKDANIAYAGFTNDEGLSGIVGEVNQGAFFHY